MKSQKPAVQNQGRPQLLKNSCCSQFYKILRYIEYLADRPHWDQNRYRNRNLFFVEYESNQQTTGR